MVPKCHMPKAILRANLNKTNQPKQNKTPKQPNKTQTKASKGECTYVVQGSASTFFTCQVMWWSCGLLSLWLTQQERGPVIFFHFRLQLFLGRSVRKKKKTEQGGENCSSEELEVATRYFFMWLSSYTHQHLSPTFHCSTLCFKTIWK